MQLFLGPVPPCKVIICTSTLLPRSMRAQLVTYNPNAQVFGYWRLDLTWLDSGVIRATASLLGLPAISYGESIRNMQVGLVRICP